MQSDDTVNFVQDYKDFNIVGMADLIAKQKKLLCFYQTGPEPCHNLALPPPVYVGQIRGKLDARQTPIRVTLDPELATSHTK